MYRVNKYIDLIDRTVWTFIQCLIGAFVVWGFDDWKKILSAAGISAAAALTKAKGAQEIGGSGMGDAVPGRASVEEVEITTDDQGNVTAVEA